MLRKSFLSRKVVPRYIFESCHINPTHHIIACAPPNRSGLSAAREETGSLGGEERVGGDVGGLRWLVVLVISFWQGPFWRCCIHTAHTCVKGGEFNHTGGAHF